MTKNKTVALILVFLLVLLTACTANTESTDGEDKGAPIYTREITLCALQSENSSSLEQVSSPLSQRIEHMGYGGSCSVNGGEVILRITSDHEIMRDEREDIIRRMCMSGDITFDDSDGKTHLTRADFQAVSCRFDERYYIDVSLNDSGKEKYSSLAESVYEKWQSVENYVSLCCDGEELARVTVNEEKNEWTDTVSFSGTLTADMAQWIVYAYENPLPFALQEKI